MGRITVLVVATASLLSCTPSEKTQTPDLLYVWAFDTNQEDLREALQGPKRNIAAIAATKAQTMTQAIRL